MNNVNINIKNKFLAPLDSKVVFASIGLPITTFNKIHTSVATINTLSNSIINGHKQDLKNNHLTKPLKLCILLLTGGDNEILY